MKVGDTVVHDRVGFYYQSIRLYEIVRETPKMFILSNGMKFWKENNIEVGNWQSKIEEFTPELQEKYKRQNHESSLRSKISKLDQIKNKIPSNLDIKELNELAQYLETVITKIEEKTKKLNSI